MAIIRRRRLRLRDRAAAVQPRSLRVSVASSTPMSCHRSLSRRRLKELTVLPLSEERYIRHPLSLRLPRQGTDLALRRTPRSIPSLGSTSIRSRSARNRPLSNSKLDPRSPFRPRANSSPTAIASLSMTPTLIQIDPHQLVQRSRRRRHRERRWRKLRRARPMRRKIWSSCSDRPFDAQIGVGHRRDSHPS